MPSTMWTYAVTLSNAQQWVWRICTHVMRISVTHRQGRLGLALFGIFGVLGTLACGGDAAGPNPPAPQNVLLSFAFQWPAVNLALTAPYDTVQLVAIPRTASGAVITDTGGGTPVVHYTSPDSAIRVSATGLVTAHSVTAGARVIARVTIGGITRTDTALVQVTPAPLPAPFSSLSIHPQPGGLAEARANLNFNGLPAVFPFSATIASGDPATDTICTVTAGCQVPLLVHYTSSDPAIGTIDQYGQLQLKHAGRVIVTASTIAYGVHKVDSLPFVIGYVKRAAKFFQFDNTRSQPFYIDGTQGRDPIPYSVGMQFDIENYAAESYIITLPEPMQGTHFIDSTSYTSNAPEPTQAVDTLPTCAENCGANAVFVQFDSAGTYIVQYRGMQTGTRFADTLTILPYP